MELAIYTYGYIDSMFYILNAIAMFMSSEFVSKLITTVAFIGFVFYGIKMAYSNGNYKSYFVKIVAITIIINACLIPKTDMIIIDYVSKKTEKIDNIPYGFAIPVGLLESFGNALTAGFEQMFTLPGNTNYRDYGMIFGLRLIEEARNWKIKTPEFAENIDNFIKRCALREAALGYKYTINTLLNSEDIWRLVSSNASRLRRVEIRLAEGVELLTCQEAAKELSSHFKSEIDIINRLYKNTEFNSASASDVVLPRGVESIGGSFKKNIENVFSSFGGGKILAETMLRQYMMINALSNNSNSFGYARAAMQQESNWSISGDLAKIYVPILLTVIKAIVYASFIFLVPMMLISGGITRYLSWMSIVISLQLWPSLNAVLNMFMDLYSSNYLQGISDGVISFTSYSRVGNYADKIVAVASGLQMAVPFLAFSLVQGGVSGFIHLAGNITGASSTAATTAAQEVVTGNKSFDNSSLGNSQIATQTGFKTDFNGSYKEGGFEYQNIDGRIDKVLPSGKMIGMSGAGFTESVGSNRIMFNEEKTNQLHNSYSENMSSAESEQLVISKKKESLDSMLRQYAENISRHKSSGKGISWEKLGSQREAVQNAINHANNISKDFSKTKSNTAELSGALSGDLSFGSGGIGAGGSIRASLATSNSSNQSINEQSLDTKHQDWSKSREALYQASQNHQFSKSAGVSKDLVNNISSAYQEIESLDISRSKHLEEAKQIQRQLADVNSQNIADNQDITSEVKRELVDRYNFSSIDADRLINNPADYSISEQIKRKSAIESVTKKYSKPHSIGSIDKEATYPEMKDVYEKESKNLEDRLDIAQQNIGTLAAEDGLELEQVRKELEEEEIESMRQYQASMNKVSVSTTSAFLENNEKFRKKEDEMSKKKVGE